MSILGSIFRRFVEREGRKKTVAEWGEELEKSGLTVYSRMDNCNGTEKDRTQGRHVVGIERWSQSRLRVFLGDELVREEYDDYRPGAESDMMTLCQAFEATRKETLDLAAKLEEAAVPVGQTVAHNDLGDLTVQGWLAYIDGHALRESKGIKENK